MDLEYCKKHNLPMKNRKDKMSKEKDKCCGKPMELEDGTDHLICTRCGARWAAY